jgi:hypothetical protein
MLPTRIQPRPAGLYLKLFTKIYVVI